jgi:hypothetical protein
MFLAPLYVGCPHATGQAPHVLSKPHGVFYLVGIEENRPDELVAVMRERFGLSGSYCQRQTCGIESLFVLKFTWAAAACCADKSVTQ